MLTSPTILPSITGKAALVASLLFLLVVAQAASFTWTATTTSTSSTVVPSTQTNNMRLLPKIPLQLKNKI